MTPLPLLSLLGSLLLSCSGGEGEPGVCQEPEAEPSWQAVPIPGLRETVSGLATVRAIWRSSGSDNLYLQDEIRSQIRVLRPTWIQPEGDFCLSSNSPAENCTDGAFFSAGLVEVPSGRGACLDEQTGMLQVVQGAGDRVTTVSTTRRDSTWASYNRALTGWSPQRADDENLSDACASREGRVALAGGSQVVVYEPGGGVQARLPFRQPVEHLSWIGSAGQLVARTSNGGAWVLEPATGRSWQVAALDSVQAMAVDEARGRAWLLGTDGGLTLLDLGADGLSAARTIELCGMARDLAVDLESGALHLLVDEDDGGGAIWVLDGDRVRVRIALQEEAIALLPPGRTGQAAVLVAAGSDEQGQPLQATRAWWIHDPAVELPALSMFVVTTLEQPFTNADMACTRAENPGTNFSDYVDQLRENIPIAADLGMPVAVGITWEFLTKARECGLEGVIDELDEAGFELGTMIHAMPCYSCTDQNVPGESPETCNELDENYQAADAEEACWPSNPDYCSSGDQPCWLSWVGAKALDVDEAIPGGSRFIFGADRHRLRSFEYISEGYRTFPRADGGVGYDITFFQGTWIYPEITSTEDPRGKDSAPLNPDLLGKTWFLADVQSWEQDSAFSDLLYMPGSTVALSRLYDMELSDLSQGHVTDEISPMVITAEDAATVEAWLARALTRREDRPGSFYFHLADLSGYKLRPGSDPDRAEPEQVMLEMKDRIDQRWGSQGLGWVEWRGPVELREQVEASR